MFDSNSNLPALGILTLPDRLLPCFWLLILDASFVPLHVHEHLRPSRSPSESLWPLTAGLSLFWSLPYGLLAFFFPRSPMNSGRGLNKVFPLYSRWCLSTFPFTERMLLSSFFACAFSTIRIRILFSFLAVAVNSNSCGTVQWRYKRFIQFASGMAFFTWTWMCFLTEFNLQLVTRS